MREKFIFVNDCLKELQAIMPEDAIVKADYIRFQDGAGKVKVPTECRDQDVFIICDVNDKTPNPYTGQILSPDDHVRDIERTVGALKDNPARKNLIIPFQPYGRQHRREFGESTEAADYLRDCHYLGFRNILTADSHDPDAAAAISKHNFDNMFVTNEMLKEMVINEKIDYHHPENILVVAPDEGAQKRARHFADRFGCNHAFFSKRRDVTKIIDGKNPLVSKQFVGFSPKNKTVIIVDDMISSGGTIIETAKELKKMGADRIYVCATFGLFTKGTSEFIKAYQDDIINGTYISNLTYLKEMPMDGIHIIDCTSQLKTCIDAIHAGKENILEELGMSFIPVSKLVEEKSLDDDKLSIALNIDDHKIDLVDLKEKIAEKLSKIPVITFSDKETSKVNVNIILGNHNLGLSYNVRKLVRKR